MRKRLFLQRILSILFIMRNNSVLLNGLLLYILCMIPADMSAQRHEILDDNIRTLQVVAGDDWLGLPIISLDGDEVVNVSFDELSHVIQRYSYSIVHCEADWSESEIFDSDYLDGFTSGLTIDNISQSLNTATLYTHYNLQIPNENCRLRMSGNYCLTVTDDNDDNRVVLKAYFAVVDRKFGVSMNMTTNTDVGNNTSYQQLNVKVQYNGVNVTFPEREIKTFTLQNNRWSTARALPRPTTIRHDGQEWNHCRDLIYPATNEYRKFEFLDIHRNSMGVESTGYEDGVYHAWLYTDTPRRNYIYDEDANGAFYIRNTDNINNDTESEYFRCHFSYRPSEPFNGKVYLNGQWTYDSPLPQYEMKYDALSKLYTCDVDLKMGYYSYQYVLAKDDGTLTSLPSEGNFFETENTYACLVYYRPQGGRADLLYGFSAIR